MSFNPPVDLPIPPLYIFYSMISVGWKKDAKNAKKVLDMAERQAYLEHNRNRKAPPDATR